MENVLEIRKLCRKFDSFALDNVSLSIPRGHVMGLIGPNGAGKTTTLKLIMGLLPRDSGEIRVFGLDPLAHGAEVRGKIGFVHDEPKFYRHLTLAQNASLISGLYSSWDDSTFRRLAADFGLPLRKRFSALSRGNRTKFALALALSHSAELILMDEPTTGLDPVFRRELLDVLLATLERDGATILFSTHITADLDGVSDYVSLLQAGRLKFTLEKDALLERWGLVKGGLDLLEGLPDGFFRGLRRGEHGFEALTDDARGARARFGGAALVERPTLEDIVLHTTGGGRDA